MNSSNNSVEFAQGGVSTAKKAQEQTVHQSRLAWIAYINAAKEAGNSDSSIREYLVENCEPSQKRLLKTLLQSRLSS